MRCGPALSLMVVLAAAVAQESPPPVSTGYLDSERTGNRVRLLLGRQVLVPEKGAGPSIALYAMQHTADREFYTTLQERLKDHDLVLYEALRPGGVDPRVALDARARVIKSQIAVRCMKVLLERHRAAHGAYPAGLDACAGGNPRVQRWFDLARKDAWGHPLAYTRSGDGASARIRSLGADGLEGGEGEDADLDFADQIPLLANETEIDGKADPRPDGIGLYPQNRVLDTSGDRFLRSDVSVDHVSRWMAREGGDWEPLKKVFEGQVEGQASVPKDKRGLKEIIGVLQLILKSRTGYRAHLGPGANPPPSLKAFLKVTIDERNQVVVDDLKAILAGATPYEDRRSIGILYGAGHMIDLQRRIQEQCGYRPAAFEWMTCIEIEVPPVPEEPR